MSDHGKTSVDHDRLVQLQPVIIGTAGHIDHGKTTLVEALTGVDCDRLAEEKERGITIELGFAPLDLAIDGRTVRCGVVDVPGHERFVKNMVAGASGIDVLLLVVAADEAVMPQTREHLDICQLLEVTNAVIALTKIDLVDTELRELAAEDVRTALAETPFADAPLVPCSATTGAGLDALREHLAAVARQVETRTARGVARLPADRAFTMRGHGTVVTGTLAAGRIQVGDELEVLPSRARAKVRAIQAYGEARESVQAGTRTALNLQGLSREQIGRGSVLAPPGALRMSRATDVLFQVVPGATKPLAHRARVLLHANTAQLTATISLFAGGAVEPGGHGYARLLIDEPGAALWGRERFIARATGPVTAYGKTLGGGVVLDPDPPRRPRRNEEVLSNLQTLARGELPDRVVVLVEEADTVGVRAPDLLRRTGADGAELERTLSRLGSSGAVVRFDKEHDAYVGRGTLDRLFTAARAALTAFHERFPLRAGIPRAELHTRLGGEQVPPRLLHVVLERMQGIAQQDDAVRLEGFRPGRGSSVVERVRGALQSGGLTPPRPDQIADDAAAQEVQEALGFLVQSGEAVRTRDGLVFSAASVAELRERLVAYLKENGEVTAQDFKAMVGASRKFTIPLAELFDAEKVTIRVGDKRILRGTG